MLLHDIIHTKETLTLVFEYVVRLHAATLTSANWTLCGSALEVGNKVESLSKLCSKRKESKPLEKATEVSSQFLIDLTSVAAVSFFNTLLTETQAVDALIGILLFIGP